MNILFTYGFKHRIHHLLALSLSLTLSPRVTSQKCKKPSAHLYPLLPVYLHTVGAQRGDGSVDDLLHHLSVAIGFLKLGGRDPDVAICRDVLAGFVQNAPGVLIRLKAGQRQPQLEGGKTCRLRCKLLTVWRRRDAGRERKRTSTLVGQHSTALLSMILASSGSSSSTAVFHNRTDLDTFSRAAQVSKM